MAARPNRPKTSKAPCRPHIGTHNQNISHPAPSSAAMSAKTCMRTQPLVGCAACAQNHISVGTHISRASEMNRSISTINADVAHQELGALGSEIVLAVVSNGIDSSHRHFETHETLALPDGLTHLDISQHGDDELLDLIRDETQVGPFGEKSSTPSYHPGMDLGTGIASVIAGESVLPEDYFDPEHRTMKGMAPLCKILSIDTFGASRESNEMRIIAALRSVNSFNENGARIRVHAVLLPLEISWEVAIHACGYSPVCVDVDRLVRAEVVVVSAAGNRAYDGECRDFRGGVMWDPGNAPNAITVGSTHRSLPQEYGPSYFSCRGPTADGRMKPDLLAPGEKIYACDSSEAGTESSYRYWDGTSLASAHVAGAVAALLSVRRDLIGKPLEVKDLLMRTARDLGRERSHQGAGLVDVYSALQETSRDRRPRGATATPAPVKVFCSYSHLDSVLMKEFETHLAPMERMGLITLWSDQAIPAGTEWESQIQNNLESAEIVLLVVSSYFIASDYCWSKELARSLERYQTGDCRIIPVLARPVDVDGTQIARLQRIPKQPVTAFKDPHEGWSEVAAKVRQVVLELRAVERA